MCFNGLDMQFFFHKSPKELQLLNLIQFVVERFNPSLGCASERRIKRLK